MAQSKNYAYKNNWNKENLDRVNLTMEKGKKRNYRLMLSRIMNH